MDNKKKIVGPREKAGISTDPIIIVNWFDELAAKVAGER